LQRGTHYSMTTVLLVWSALLAYNCSWYSKYSCAPVSIDSVTAVYCGRKKNEN
jgi:hypothetical protein